MSKIDLKDKIIAGYRNVESDKLLGIFGNPIKHTLSPVIHDTISDYYSFNERYIPFEIEDNLGDYVKAAYDLGIIGLNITVPYKEKVIPYLSDIDEDAKKIGAVNTLVRSQNGYKGYNTDMEGLYRSIIEANEDIKDKEIIMLGAGGAARAVAYMCFKYKASKAYIINRSVDKAQRLAEDMNAMDDKSSRFISISSDKYETVPEGRYIFIQCTSVGLKEDDGLPLVTDKEFYKQACFAVDLIYNPAKTAFIKLMEDNNIPAINGLKMLLYQGIIANDLWNNTKINNELTAQIYDKLYKKIYG